MLEYKKMSLFDAEKGSILVHACNAQGVWGSGIAKEFKSRFPEAFEKYQKYCAEFGFVGTAPIISANDGDYWIGNLITSLGYGSSLDSKEEIIINTVLALNSLCFNLDSKDKIYSNKFNSGLFKVPWEETERILKVFVNRYNLNWIVCDPNLEIKE